MSATGKRNRSYRDNDGDARNQKRRAADRDDNMYGELVLYRILCPDTVIGSVIGKSGKVINAIRQESRAKVKVVDPFPGSTDRVIMVYCHVREKVSVEIEDDIDEKKPLCPAHDGLLRLHAAIAGAIEAISESDKKQEVQCQILVPSSQSANIIGKGGSTIKKLRSKAKANIKIIPKDASVPNHSCAMDFDNFVLISGESDAVKKALYAVSAIMYKFSPKESVPIETPLLEAAPSIIVPTDVPLFKPGGLYQNTDAFLPSRSMPPLFPAGYAPDFRLFRESGSSMPDYSSSHLPIAPTLCSKSRSEELKLKVLCPLNKIGRVIGKGGTTIKSIRQASGARIDVDDSIRYLDDCVVTINSIESLDDMKSMSVEAILLLQEKINDEDADVISIRLFISSKVIGCIIGKSGSIITEIRKRSKADIRISKSEKVLNIKSDDELVEITGEVRNVRDALVQIVLRLRDDLLMSKDSIPSSLPDRDGLYVGGAPFLPTISPMGSLGFDQRVDSGNCRDLLSSGRLYGIGSFPLAEGGNGSLPPFSSSKLFGGLPPPSSADMLIPSQAIGKVLGKGGSNIANIRKISGARVELADSKSGRGDRVAVISGTQEQIRSAENMIQAFIMST